MKSPPARRETFTEMETAGPREGPTANSATHSADTTDRRQKQAARPFIPAWLDDAGLSASEMRVFIHLVRSADNKTGVAWPSYRRMIEITGMSRATIARSVSELERRNLIQKAGKPFGGSCRYRILPTVSPENTLDGVNGVTREHIGEPPIVSPENRNVQRDETSIVSPEYKEGNPKKVLQRRFSNTLSETVWKLTPAIGRERSSKRQLEDALKKTKNMPPEDEIIRSLEAWVKSEAWTKDGGQYVPGIHRWITQRKWDVEPSPANNHRPTVNTALRPPNIDDV